MPEKLLVCTSVALAMKPRATESPRRSRTVQGEGPNWILIAGSALLSTLSVRLGYKLKQVLDAKQLNNSSPGLKVNGKSTNGKKSGSCPMHSNAFCFPQDEDVCYNHYSGSRDVMEIKPHVNGQMMAEPEMALPLVTVPTSEFNKENGVMWSSSPDRLELPQKPFHQSNSSDSPCVSESGSDIFSKREVIQKLRQQLKRRDDMILEMQDQIAEVQNSLAAQVSHSSHLQSLLDIANRDLFDSEREVQRLRKAIADHCVGHVNSGEKLPSVPVWPADARNGHVNGYPEVENNMESPEKGRDGEKIEMLRREVSELKELNEGKDYLLQSYKEQKSELSIKIKELQHRLDSQLPNIL
ncbi:uncharacterized protein LOC130994905 isoform X1 [Salvia miltiorrhiza]|uniref:uncharacterized protein LOC130994905 isoform X1 n=1 Tax=Salvia miltiorrhiza TaxID=226208 RepID=UPI0025AC5FE7|nr:uncharacterized protein LOC130994905 isoform X1 [Salvia miltiorrhiza]XP_057776019.1 uncharacterized protein LOC130994905 isoform X1 [Salvia miltiorrhiza]